MINIEEYLIENKEYIKGKLLIFFLILIIFIGSFTFYKIERYIAFECIVSKDLLLCPVPYQNIDNIVSNNTLYIDKNKYKYDVYSISEEVEKKGNILYKEVAIESNIKEKNIDYNVVQIRIQKDKENIFKYIKEIIGGIK